MVWQEIAVRLLFAFILGSATAIAKKWYQTRQCIQSNTLMALGAAMFSILAGSTSGTRFSSQLIIGISILCVGIGFGRQADIQTSSDRIMRLWCAGVVGSMVGFGLFVPSYIGILIVILTNLLFSVPETGFTPYIEQELNSNPKPKTQFSQTNSNSQEIRYRCQVNCLATDEAEVLALLVQLGREQNLTPTGIHSRNLVEDNLYSEIEIQLDFVSDNDRNLLQLQEVLMSLKSKLAVSSVSWLDLSPESSNRNDEVFLENDKLD